ncbi:hypothetical protein TPHA_0B01110 [Tetrapisispora phaffii CBS 4417]|uniref:DASH complex subunit SPC34 n=1 Tax=Tetrapisispora phaffii (strain ATCC 24235 / CBS 4417 / NBRC 1672 / NRRL Y-8282 / UCD 70-5) TaxID=1071381 RepID=G8BQI6_TETPH|nr:hypothetical protein TPHA_0B01110 [Tetrapisispora phaffii CBS 4417]CCE61783.1 hypothetical protein TPHA_0B01110 [Tetrapisispora phaffii CBS 4417]
MVDYLDELVAEINHSVTSISTLDFKAPGIFQNAIKRSNYDVNDLLERLVKDVDDERQAPLFTIDKVHKIPTRKDGKKGILDYLTERDDNLKRNRHIGLPEQLPVIHIPNDYYEKLENERNTKNRRLTRNDILLDVDAVTSSMSTASPTAINILNKKFKNNRIVTQLLSALKNGTVISDIGNGNRRKTMFVDDFPTEAIFEVLQEILTIWPSDAYEQDYMNLFSKYKDLIGEIETLQDEIRVQDGQLTAQRRSETEVSSGLSNVAQRLIAKEKRDIAKLESQINDLT